MSDFRTRLFQEKTELDIKIRKLRDFIVKAQFGELPEIDREDLREQLLHMEAYCGVLNRRVGRLCTQQATEADSTRTRNEQAARRNAVLKAAVEPE